MGYLGEKIQDIVLDKTGQKFHKAMQTEEIKQELCSFMSKKRIEFEKNGQLEQFCFDQLKDYITEHLIDDYNEFLRAPVERKNNIRQNMTDKAISYAGVQLESSDSVVQQIKKTADDAIDIITGYYSKKQSDETAFAITQIAMAQHDKGDNLNPRKAMPSAESDWSNIYKKLFPSREIKNYYYDDKYEYLRKKTFVSRQKLIEAVNSKINTSHCVAIVGDPGTGKSAFMADYISCQNVSAYFFCDWRLSDKRSSRYLINLLQLRLRFTTNFFVNNLQKLFLLEKRSFSQSCPLLTFSKCF